MKIKFTQGSTRFDLIVTRESLREAQAKAENIQPDPTLWNSKEQKRSAMNHRTNVSTKEMHSANMREHS